MEENFEETAERYATLLMSEDAESFGKGCTLIEEACWPESLDNQGRERIARIAQELAAYQGGAVLLRILEGALTEKSRFGEFEDAATAFGFFKGSCITVACLSSSKVVVERCLRMLGAGQKQSAREVYETLSARALQSARELDSERLIAYGRLMVAIPLKCVANFARAIKAFREVMKDISARRSLFEEFGYFLSADFLSKLTSGNALAIQHVLTDLIMTLTFSTDSQMWALDKGLLEMMTFVYEGSTVQQAREGAGHKGTPVLRCNAFLLHLTESEPTAEKLRAHNALALLRPHKKKLVVTEPAGIDLWEHIEAKLQHRTVVTLRGPASGRQCHLYARMTGNGTPVVCSWKLCPAGPEPVEGTKYAKSGVCRVARYCSKEHQILHWRTHKIHCQAGLSPKGSEVIYGDRLFTCIIEANGYKWTDMDRTGRAWIQRACCKGALEATELFKALIVYNLLHVGSI